MRQHLLRTIVACAAGLALSTQAQSSSSSAGGSATDPSSGTSGSSSTYPGSSSSSTTPGSYNGSSSSQSGWSGRHLSATGRMMHEPVRGSQLTGAQVSGSSGSEVGTISDTIINPASGRLEFAVISLSGNSAAGNSSSAGSNSADSSNPSSTSSTSGTSGTSGTSVNTSSASQAGGKQVAVPWMLLRPSSSAGASTSAGSTSSSSSTASTSSSSASPSFVFTGDVSKLQSAPSFDANTDLSQPSWRQSVFSNFGMMGNSSATGAAETPGGTSSSESTSPGSTSQTPSSQR